MSILTLILIAVGLSVDAFSLSLAYGLLNINSKKIIIMSFVVGIFHFVMPILGSLFATPFLKIITIDPKYIISMIFVLIIIEILKSFKEEEKEYKINTFSIILFGFVVSLDSFSVGIGLTFIYDNIILASTIFSIVSCLFTFFGLKLGKILSSKVGEFSKIFGLFLLVALVIYFLFK